MEDIRESFVLSSSMVGVIHAFSSDDDVQTWEEPKATHLQKSEGRKKETVMELPWRLLPSPAPQLELPLAWHLPSPEAGACLPALLGWGRGYHLLHLTQLLLQLLYLLLQLQCALVLIVLDREKQSVASHCSWRPQNLVSASHLTGKGGGRLEKSSPLPHSHQSRD